MKFINSGNIGYRYYGAKIALFFNYMIPASIIINDKLLETGMSQIEIGHLMAMFLEEEAFGYVECLKRFEEDAKKQPLATN